MKAKTHDLSNRAWGNNYSIMTVDGPWLKLGVWCPNSVEEGDYLILAYNSVETTRYVVEKSEWCYRPRDMYIVEARFCPR